VTGEAVAAAIATKHDQLLTALRGLSDDQLLAPSRLPDWNRLTVVCHIRFGAEAIDRLVTAALAGEAALFYPGGRAEQRPATLVPSPGEAPQDVVESLATTSAALDATLATVTDWSTMSREPDGIVDLGAMTIARLAILRLTEVEVHGADMNLGLDAWSDTFVGSALSMRLERLALRLSNKPVPDHRARGSWLLRATDGAAWLVTAGDEVTSRPVQPGDQADGVIEATRRDLLALLLGRPFEATVSYDGEFARAFKEAFPGP